MLLMAYVRLDSPEWPELRGRIGAQCLEHEPLRQASRA